MKVIATKNIQQKEELEIKIPHFTMNKYGSASAVYPGSTKDKVTYINVSERGYDVNANSAFGNYDIEKYQDAVQGTERWFISKEEFKQFAFKCITSIKASIELRLSEPVEAAKQS